MLKGRIHFSGFQALRCQIHQEIRPLFGIKRFSLLEQLLGFFEQLQGITGITGITSRICFQGSHIGQQASGGKTFQLVSIFQDLSGAAVGCQGFL
jgi:hypothetical protein